MSDFDKLPTPVKAGFVLTVFPLLIYVDFTAPKPTGMWMLFVALLSMMAVSAIYTAYRSKDVIQITQYEEAALAASKDFRELICQLENVHGLAMETMATNPEEALEVLRQLNLNIYTALNPTQE